MENARIYQVGNISSVTTFDDAFGEYSSASGRERRKKRKLERIESRREVKKARIAARDEAKSARQEARQGRKLARKQRRTAIAGERLAKRQQRVSARAERRGTKVGARLERRGQRTALRQQRRAVRRGEPEGEMDEQTATETGSVAQTDSYQEPQTQGYQDQYQEEETTQGGGYAEDGGYSEEPTDEGYEQPLYEEQDQEDEGIAEGTDADLEEDQYGGDEETNFDGTGRIAIDEKLLDVTNKIEWNNELIDRLMDKVEEAYNLGRETANIEDVIDARKERVSQLEGELDDYLNANGLTPMEATRRRKQVDKARHISKRNREKATSKRVKMIYGGSETPVESELNPEFSPNRIEIPAEPKSTMTGLNGIDMIDDYDAPDTRVVELSSNFLGVDTKNINWGAIMAGIVIGGVAIYALKKYKVLDKI